MPNFLRVLSLALVAVLGVSQDVPDPWPKADLMAPAVLAQAIQAANPPVVLCVAFPVLYRNKHILHAIAAGPGSKAEGIEALKKAVANVSKDAALVIYCGCCPMAKCPNVRPAYRTLKEMGYTHVRVADIPTNMNSDWFSKDYPSELGSAAAPK